MERQDSVANHYDVLPPVRERLKLGDSIKRKPRGPDAIPWHTGPKGYPDTFKPSGGPKTGISYLLDGQNLEDEVSNGTCTCIHQTVVAGGTLSFHVSGFELAVPSMPPVSAEPHINVARNNMVKPKCVTDALGEKGTGVTSLLVVHNNGGLKRKKRN